MNYWLLTTEYPPFYGGGISTYCYHTARMLLAQGHAVTVFVPGDHIRDHDIVHRDGIRLVRFGKNRTGSEAFLGYVPALSYEFASMTRDMIRKEGKPDCIESQDYLAIPYYLLQMRLLQCPEFEGVPVVLTLHSPAFLYQYYNRDGIYEFPDYWTGELEKSCIQSADHIISPSQYIVDEIRKFTPVDSSRLSVIRNPYLQEATSGETPAVVNGKIVFYGKLTPQKGVFEMFADMKQLWDEGPTYPLTVIGGMDKVYHPDMKTMGQVIQQKYAAYIDRGLVRFNGNIPPAQMAASLSDAHVILIPSTVDNLPYAAIEAMTLGKIVLASRQGGQAEIIQHGVTGFLFDHREPGSFAGQLQHILSLPGDAIRQTGHAARQEMEQLLNYEHIYQQKIAVIRKVCNADPVKRLFPFTRETRPAAAYPENGSSNTLLTVVIPYYNMGRYIEECLASVLASAYTNLEILIINDGSNDPQSLEALEQVKRKKAVTVIDTKNVGLALTRNLGGRLAKGSFLAFLDADDKVHPHYYSKAISVLQQYDNVYFAGTWVQYFGSKRTIWPSWTPEPPYILLHNTVNSSALVYKTASFLAGGINDPALEYGLEDYESVINMLHHGFRGVVLPECLFYYRIRSNSMYRKLTRHRLLHAHQYIAGKHAALYSDHAETIFNLVNANGPSYAYENPSFAVQPSSMLNRARKLVKRYPALKRILLRFKGILKV